MRRREFIAAVGSFAIRGARQPKVPVIGYLSLASPETYQKQLAAFWQGLREGGPECLLMTQSGHRASLNGCSGPKLEGLI